MVAGHSYMPCDRAFGHIEQEFGGQWIECPDHYARVIAEARKNLPINVIRMSSTDFYDFKPLKDYITMRKLPHNMLFSKGRTFTIDRVQPWSYCIEIDQCTERIDLRKYVKIPPVKGAGQAALDQRRKEREPQLLSDVKLQKPYEGLIIKLDGTKAKHLSQLINYLGEEGRGWGEHLLNLQSNATPVDDTPSPEETPNCRENMQDEDQEDTVLVQSVYPIE